MLHIHGTQEGFSWHIGYNIHYVTHGYTVYTPTSQRGPSQAVSLCEASHPSIVLSGKPGDEATRAIAGAQAEVAGARAPVCPSLATPLPPTLCSRWKVFFVRIRLSWTVICERANEI